MKTKLFRVLALASLVFFFNGCTPDEVETTQDQFKPLIIRLTLTEPIAQSSLALGTYDRLYVQSTYFTETIDGEYPNQAGRNSIEYSTTALSNSSISFYIDYLHLLGTDVSGYPIYQCNTLNLELIYNGQTVYNQSRDLGSEDGTCPDGHAWQVSYTLP